MSITQGTYTLGSGGNYADLKTAIDDILKPASRRDLTGDLTFVLISDITEVSANDAVNIRCNGYTFRITSLNKGGQTLINNTGGILLTLGNIADEVTSANYVFDSFVWKSSGNGNGFIDGDKTNVTTNYLVYDIQFNMVDYTTTCLLKIVNADSPSVFNLKVYSCKGTANVSDSIIQVENSKLENTTVYFITPGTNSDGINVDANSIARNNVVIRGNVGGGTGKAFIWDASSQGYNNASDDDSADDSPVQSDNIINIVAADEFQSLVSTNEYFLFPLITGQLDTSGSTPGISSNLHGLEGYPRPRFDGLISIGAHELSSLINIRPVKNLFLADFLRLLKNLLPIGIIWKNMVTLFYDLLEAFGVELNRYDTHTVDFQTEIIPGLSTSGEMLEDWERIALLADEYPADGTTEIERQVIVQTKLHTALPGPTEQFFTDYATSLNITITSFGSISRFRVGTSRVGDRINDADSIGFTWVVNYTGGTSAERQAMKTYFERLKPAHTTVVFNPEIP